MIAVTWELHLVLVMEPVIWLRYLHDAEGHVLISDPCLAGVVAFHRALGCAGDGYSCELALLREVTDRSGLSVLHEV